MHFFSWQLSKVTVMSIYLYFHEVIDSNYQSLLHSPIKALRNATNASQCGWNTSILRPTNRHYKLIRYVHCHSNMIQTDTLYHNNMWHKLIDCITEIYEHKLISRIQVVYDTNWHLISQSSITQTDTWYKIKVWHTLTPRITVYQMLKLKPYSCIQISSVTNCKHVLT